MSINLLSMLQDQMGGAVAEQASKFLGESSANTTAGIGALLPSLLGGIIGKGSTESGATGIMDMITKGNHDGGIMDSLGSMFGGGSSTSNLMNAGSLLTSGLFGGSKLGSVLDIVTSATGMRRSSSSSLMNLLAPVVMGMIGKQIKSGGLNASGLMNMLMGQKEHVASALPAGMGSILGFANTSNTTSTTDKVKSTASSAAARTTSAARDTVKEAASVTTDAAATGGSMLRWALPLVAVLGIAGYLWTSMGGSTTGVADVTGDAIGTVTNAGGDMVDGATKSVNAAGNAVAGAAGSMKDAAGNMVDGAKNAAGNATNAAGNMVDGAKNAAGGMVDGAKNTAGGMVDGAKNAAGNMVDGAKNAGGNMVDGAKNAGGKMVDGAKNAAGGMVDGAGGKKLGGKMIDGAKNAGGKMVDGAKDLGGKLKKPNLKGGDVTGATGAAGGALSAAGAAAQEKFSGMFKTGSSASAFTLSDIKFDPTGNKITSYSKDEVMALAAALKADPNAKIQVQAFGKNKAIATGRAKLIEQILTTLGVKAGQLSTKGMSDGADNNNIQVVVK